MRTKNSAENSPIFQRCLNSIQREIPVNRLLLLDDSESRSQTIPITQAVFPHKTHVYGPFGNRALATQAGIDEVETDWFLIVDDDVILCRDWFRNALDFTKPSWEAAMIWGWPKNINPHSRNRAKLMQILRGRDEYHLARKNFIHRGGLHDTLVKTESVEGVKIPKDLHIYEDWFLKEHVWNRGYYTYYPSNVWCYHFLNVHYSVSSMYELGRLNKKYGIYSRKYTLMRLVSAVPKAFLVLVASRDTTAFADQLKYYVYESLGFLRTQILRPPPKYEIPFSTYQRVYDFREKQFVELKEGD